MLRFFLSCFVAVFVANTPVLAQDTMKEVDARFDKRLNRYEPTAVAAARSYAKSFDTSTQLKSMSDSMRRGLVQQMRSKNPRLKEADLDIFFEEFFRVALVESAPLLEKFAILNMLEVLTPEEIIALDAFYSTPIGKSVTAKFPQLMARMPQIMEFMEKTFIPAGLAAAQAKLRAKGVGIKI